MGIIQADSHYVEDTGENLQGEVEQADSQACGSTKTKTSQVTERESDNQLN